MESHASSQDFGEVKCRNHDMPAYGGSGVDLTLIRWMLSLTPAQRLEALQQTIESLEKLRRAKHGEVLRAYDLRRPFAPSTQPAARLRDAFARGRRGSARNSRTVGARTLGDNAEVHTSFADRSGGGLRPGAP